MSIISPTPEHNPPRYHAQYFEPGSLIESTVHRAEFVTQQRNSASSVVVLQQPKPLRTWFVFAREPGDLADLSEQIQSRCGALESFTVFLKSGSDEMIGAFRAAFTEAGFSKEQILEITDEGPLLVDPAKVFPRSRPCWDGMFETRLRAVYHPSQVPDLDVSGWNSRSPEKAALLIKHLEEQGLLELLEFDRDFSPFTEDDFKIAHETYYVEAYFRGEQPLCSSSGLPWSRELAESVRYTNASLYYAIRRSLENPEQVTLSPTSGFHHARPDAGSGSCTFSGQVIAAVKLFRERGARGAFLDLDGHFGNSIEDSRGFVPELNLAIPRGCNINPGGVHARYLASFGQALDGLRRRLVAGEVDYLVFCHGADSHQDDDLGSQCTTDEWLECSRMFYQFVKSVSEEMARPIPLALSLFGGYRRDDYGSVLSLHTADLAACLEILGGRTIGYIPEVRPNPRRSQG